MPKYKIKFLRIKFQEIDRSVLIFLLRLLQLIFSLVGASLGLDYTLKAYTSVNKAMDNLPHFQYYYIPPFYFSVKSTRLHIELYQSTKSIESHFTHFGTYVEAYILVDFQKHSLVYIFRIYVCVCLYIYVYRNNKSLHWRYIFPSIFPTLLVWSINLLSTIHDYHGLSVGPLVKMAQQYI